MADFGSPVAQNVNVNPQQGVQTLSGLVGLQQQQQALSTQTAEAQQANQKNAELQALSSFTKNAAQDPAFHNEDGSLNTQKFQAEAMKVAPVYGQAYIGQATSNANASVENRGALLKLTNEQRATIGSVFGAVAADPNATPAQFRAATQQVRAISDDPSYQNMVDRMLTSTPSLQGLTDAQASQGIRQVARNIAVTTGAGNAALSAPNVAQVQTRGGVQPTNMNPMAPGGTGAVGAAIPNAVAPGILVDPRTGQPTTYGPGGAGANAGSGAGSGPNPTTQDWTNFGGYQANLNNRVRVASDVIPRIQMAEQAMDQIRGGAGAQTRLEWAKKLQAIHAPDTLVNAVAGGDIAAAQEAEKLLFQTTFAGLKQSMQGDPARVAEFDAAEKVFPTIGTDPRASKRVLGFMVDQGQRDFSEQQELTKARKDGSFNPATWEADYQAKLRAGQVKGVAPSQVPGSSAPRTVTRTGTYKGKKVTQYSDGSIEAEK